MNCQDFELIILALARNQWQDAAARAQSRAHAEVCVRCAARLSEERTLLAGIGAVRAEIAQEEAPARVEAALLTALRAQTELRERSKPQPVPVRRMPWRIAAAFAGVIFIVILMGVMWLKANSGEPKQAAQPLPAPPTNPAPPSVVAHETVNVAAQKLPREVVRTNRGKARRTVRPEPAQANEVASPFYLLVEEGELTPLESGRVVRVEVPASALISLGLPITAENSNRSVQADLLLGQDGLARAIRFLP